MKVKLGRVLSQRSFTLDHADTEHNDASHYKCLNLEFQNSYEVHLAALLFHFRIVKSILK